MPARKFVRIAGAVLALAMLMLFSPPPRALAAGETVTCAVCGKQVKKEKAIRVIQNGRVYYVCSQECLQKLQKKKK
jgi:YHS domain-containing protein